MGPIGWLAIAALYVWWIISDEATKRDDRERERIVQGMLTDIAKRQSDLQEDLHAVLISITTLEAAHERDERERRKQRDSLFP
jgi:hypothetical protein